MKNLLKVIIVYSVIIMCGISLFSCKNNDVYDAPIVYQDAVDAGIPKISVNSRYLDTDFETLKIRNGYDLHGPGWNSISESVFNLNNIEDVDCYMDISSHDELIGVKNGKIVFWGKYNLGNSTYVKDLLPDSALSIEPAVYSVSGNIPCVYVWKLNNGYMAVNVFLNNNFKFYDQGIYSVLYVTDLTYLSYIK